MLQETQWAVCNMNYFNTIIPYNTKKNPTHDIYADNATLPFHG